MSVRVDPGLLGSARLLRDPLDLRTAAAPVCARSSASALHFTVSSESWLGRLIAAVSAWPDRPWFWVATAALVAALVAIPSKTPSVAATDPGADPSFADALPQARPPIAEDLLFSQANLRFCRFQQVRLEAIGPLTHGADLAVFQALAKDWNARCARFGYLPADRRVVDAEAIERRETLESEGRALLAAWRRKVQFGVVAPAGPNVLGHRASSSIDPPLTGRGLPPLITLGIPGKVDPEPVSWPLLKAPSVALLHQSVAARVQRRLNDLGYVISPADGTWGASSRIALRHFKETNGLLWDDILDAETVTRLFSTSAVSAPVGGWTKPDDAAAFQSAYPPPAGARTNPLNREDAEQIQRRLAELGYYAGSDDGVWGAASRGALRAFKAVSGLSDNEEWDAPTEQGLLAEQALRATDKALVPRPKTKLGGIETKLDPASARTAVPMPAKRPTQASAPGKPAGRPAGATDRPRPPAPIPARDVVAVHVP